jgi:hypothetical protein
MELLREGSLLLAREVNGRIKPDGYVPEAFHQGAALSPIGSAPLDTSSQLALNGQHFFKLASTGGARWDPNENIVALLRLASDWRNGDEWDTVPHRRRLPARCWRRSDLALALAHVPVPGVCAQTMRAHVAQITT